MSKRSKTFVLFLLIIGLGACLLAFGQKGLERTRARLSCKVEMMRMLNQDLPDEVSAADFEKAQPRLVTIFGRGMMAELGCAAVLVERDQKRAVYLITLEGQVSVHAVRLRQ